MVIFVGDRESGYFVEEVARVYMKEEVAYIDENINIDEQVSSILQYGTCSYMVFDVTQYQNTAEHLIETINNLKKTQNAKVVIFAPGFSMQSEIIIWAKSKGICYIITEVSFLEQKETFLQCTNGYYDVARLKETPTIPEEQIAKQQEKKAKAAFDGKFIAVAGTCHRIGTTTQAIQIVKYLMMNGFKACYIQMNASGFCECIENVYELNFVDPDLGLLQCENIDFFYKQEKLSEILQMDYDYYVYDYGVYTEPEFNKVSFLEKNLRIFVTGSFATEIVDTERLIKNESYADVLYIFSFVPDSEKADIKDFFQDVATKIYFSDEIRDPFTLSSTEVYETIIPIMGSDKSATKKNKFLFKEELLNGKTIKSILGRNRANG